MNLAERPGLRLFTLCALYCAQGIPWGFMAVTLPAYLGERGLGAEAIAGVVAMTYTPYAFKWLLGPVIDAFTIPRFGRRRPWIVFAQAAMALTVAALIAIPDLTENVELLTWMIMVHTIFNMMQDVAVDALAIDLLDEEERGRANGLMYASKYGGGAIGGAGLSTVMGWTDLRTALIVQVALLVAIMMLPLFVRERSVAPAARPQIGKLVRGLLKVFTVRSAILGAVVMLSSTLAIGMLTVTASVLFTQKLGWSATAYAQVAGGPGLAAGLVGAIVGGYFADRVGHRMLAAIACGGLAIVWAGFALAESQWTNDQFVLALLVAQMFLTAVMTVSLFALCMDLSWVQIAATQFTAYMALSNIATSRGAKLAPWVSDHFTDAGVYLVAAGMQLGVVLLFPLIDPHETQRKLGGEAQSR